MFIVFFAFIFILGFVDEGVCLLLALLIHECGHIAAALALGFKVEKLSLQPLGGYLYLDQMLEVQPQSESRVALAGPMANLIALAAVMALVKYTEQSNFVAYFIRANLALMIFNLLPALPLDGGRVLRSRLTGWFSYYRATEIVIACGYVCGGLLLVFGAFTAFQANLNPTIFAAGVFLLYNAYVEKKQLLIPVIRYVLGRQKSLHGGKLMAAQVLVATPEAKVNEVLKHIRPQKYYQVSVLNKEQKISGTLTEHQLLRQIMAGTGQRTLLDVVEGERED